MKKQWETIGKWWKITGKLKFRAVTVWLVVDFHPSEKYEFVNGDDYSIPNNMEK